MKYSEENKMKCKNCGKMLDLSKAVDRLLICEGCSTPSILYKETTTAEATELLAKGNRMLDTGNFGEAYQYFKLAAKKSATESEAYWGMALAEFRVRYRKDVLRNRLQPVVRGAVMEKFQENLNYQKAMLFATLKTRKEYHRLAMEIDAAVTANGGGIAKPVPAAAAFKPTNAFTAPSAPAHKPAPAPAPAPMPAEYVEDQPLYEERTFAAEEEPETIPAEEFENVPAEETEELIAEAPAVSEPAEETEEASVTEEMEAPVDEEISAPVAEQPVAAEEPVTEFPAEEIAEKPVAEFPAEEYAEEPVAEFPTEEYAEEPVAEFPAEEIAEEPVAEFPAEEIAEEPVTEFPTEEIAEEPVAEFPAAEITEEPVAEVPAEEPLADFEEESGAEEAETPVYEEVTESEEVSNEPAAEEAPENNGFAEPFDYEEQPTEEQAEEYEEESDTEESTEGEGEEESAAEEYAEEPAESELESEEEEERLDEFPAGAKIEEVSAEEQASMQGQQMPPPVYGPIPPMGQPPMQGPMFGAMPPMGQPPMQGFAPNEPPKEFEIVNGEIVKYMGTGSTVVIPVSVTSIKEGAFEGNKVISRVIIPNSVVKIGSRAFANCHSLRVVMIPESVVTMEKDVFIQCNEILVLNCASGKEPKTWDKNWNKRNDGIFGGRFKAIWGYKG